MQQYNLNKTVGVVEVPKDAKDFEVVTNQSVIPYGKTLNYEDKPFRGYRNYCGIDLPEGNWEFLSLSKDMTEEKAEILFPCQYDGREDENIKGLIYECFDDSNFTCHTALESLRSWEQANGYVTVNPYEKPDKLSVLTIGTTKYFEQLERFEEAQQQVVNIAYLIK